MRRVPIVGAEECRRALALNRCLLKIARDAPELSPAMAWLAAISSAEPELLHWKRDEPSLEEIGAILTLGGTPVAELLDLTGTGRYLTWYLYRASGRSLLESRLIAAKRFGFGVESLL